MTENKRFKLSYPNGAFLIDGDEPLCHMKNDLMIIDLLNEQHETIQRLQIELEDEIGYKNKYKKEANDYLERYLQLKQENEQLKKVAKEFAENPTQHNLWKLRTVLKSGDVE